MDDVTESLSPARDPSGPSTTPLPFREDCWTEDATYTLIDAWAERHLHFNRGILRQKHWQEVADAVNDRHGHVKNHHRTYIQCKTRIDTLKKRYKAEKARFSESNGASVSRWPFFTSLDALLGSNFTPSMPSPPAGGHRIKPPTLAPSPKSPVEPRSMTQKRPENFPTPVPLSVDASYFGMKLSAFAEAAAAAAAKDEIGEGSGSEGSSRWREGCRRRYRGEDKGMGRDRGGNREREIGYRELARAIEKFGETYERVEGKKQRQMVELEKQRMKFAKDLEEHRMQVFMEAQVELQRIKRTKRASGAGGTGKTCLLPCYSYCQPQKYEVLTRSFFM